MTLRVAAAVVGIALGLAGCVETDGRIVSTDLADAAAGSRDAPIPLRDWVDRALGSSATTPRNSTITVHEAERIPAEEALVADVEVCVEDKQSPNSFEPGIFLLQVARGVRQPASPEREPALEGGTISPGDCVRGWLTYELEADEEPAAVLLVASAYIRWIIPSAG